jgi:hypothetical protein
MSTGHGVRSCLLGSPVPRADPLPGLLALNESLAAISLLPQFLSLPLPSLGFIAIPPSSSSSLGCCLPHCPVVATPVVVRCGCKRQRSRVAAGAEVVSNKRTSRAFWTYRRLPSKRDRACVPVVPKWHGYRCGRVLHEDPI